MEETRVGRRKGKGGRKKIDEPRRKTLGIAVTEREFAALEQRACQMNVATSHLVRSELAAFFDELLKEEGEKNV